MPAGPFTYPTSPTVVSTQASQSLFTALELLRDVPQLRRQFMQRHSYRNNFYTILNEMGMGTPVKGPEYIHWEEDWIKNNFVVGSIITPATTPGTTMVIQLDSTSMYSTTISGASVALSFPKLYDIIEVPLTRIQAMVVNKDTVTNPAAHRLTLKPIKATDNLLGQVVAGGRYFITSNSFAEGMPGNSPDFFIPFRYVNNVQIVKSAFTETGSSMTNELPYEPIPGREGSFRLKGIENTEKLHRDRLSGALVFGQTIDNITQQSAQLDYATPAKGTQGMFDFAVNNGNNIEHIPGLYDIDQFYIFSEIFERERISGNSIMMSMGYRYYTELETVLKDYMNNTCFNYVKDSLPAGVVGQNVEGYFLGLGFRGATIGRYNYIFKVFDEFSDVMGAGTTGYNYPDTCVATPIATMTNRWNKNSIPSFGYRYKELGGYNREWEFFNLGGAGPIQKTDDFDLMKSHFRSEIGFEASLGNQWVVDLPTQS